MKESIKTSRNFAPIDRRITSFSLVDFIVVVLAAVAVVVNLVLVV